MIDRKHERQDELTPALRRAVDLLREEPEPGDLWRHRLLREVEHPSAPAPVVEPASSERRWSLRPWTAIAAGLLCMTIGGGAVALWQNDRADVASVTRPATSFAATSASPTSVRFTLEAPAAASVALVGDFNGWNPQALPMRRAADGSWEVDVPLAPGRYTYSFVVDGVVASDPRAPRAAGDDFGAPSSVVLVRGS